MCSVYGENNMNRFLMESNWSWLQRKLNVPGSIITFLLCDWTSQVLVKHITTYVILGPLSSIWQGRIIREGDLNSRWSRKGLRTGKENLHMGYSGVSVKGRREGKWWGNEFKNLVQLWGNICQTNKELQTNNCLLDEFQVEQKWSCSSTSASSIIGLV